MTVALAGSGRRPLAGARVVGKADPAERLEVTVLLRGRGSDTFSQHIDRLGGGDRSMPHFGREAFARQFGSDQGEVARVKRFAGEHGLAVVFEHAARRTLILSGTVAQFNRAFKVDLKHFEHENGAYRGRTGPVYLPPELRDVVRAVLGLDNRPQADPHFRRQRAEAGLRPHAAAAAFTPPQLAELYDFPKGDGKGQSIGIVELGGGYRPSDLDTYFRNLHVTAPRVMPVSVDHAGNSPTGNPDGPDGEVMLDIEVAGAVAPGANIVVYFAPNTDAGFINAVAAAVHDTNNQPSVVSISWGAAEARWTEQAMMAMDEVFQDAAAMGVTICVASGDNGSGDGVGDGACHADFPASCPHALGCGGTRLQPEGGRITEESVWNDGPRGGAGGGGVSAVFGVPSWQQGLQVTRNGMARALKGRGVPDVCANADPQTGYQVRVDGIDTVIGGTSAVAPLWAGLIARINALKGNALGYLNPLIYRHAGGFRDITWGNNGEFSAADGWDACSGLGSPHGAALLDALDVPPRAR